MGARPSAKRSAALKVVECKAHMTPSIMRIAESAQCAGFAFGVARRECEFMRASVMAKTVGDIGRREHQRAEIHKNNFSEIDAANHLMLALAESATPSIFIGFL